MKSRNLRKGGGITIAAALLLCAACTQTPERGDAAPRQSGSAQKPPPAEMMARSGSDKPETHLMSHYGIPRQEAERRLANEELVGRFRAEMFERPLPGFSDVWIRHEPAYAVVINAVPPIDRAAYLARVPEAVRGDVVFQEVKRTRVQISRDQDRIIEAFRPLGGAWSGGYEVQTDRFRFTVGAPVQLERFRRAVPEDLRADTVVEVGPQPVPL